MSNVREARAWWAHQLHATLLNSIGAAILQSQVCEQAVRDALPSSVDEVMRLRRILQELEDAARQLAAGRRRIPRDLAREVHARIQELARAHPATAIALTIRGRPAVSPRVTSGTVAVLTEALANAVRHAEPKAIEVSLTVEDGSLLLRVRDNGCGFEVAGPEPGLAALADGAPGRGLGMAIMREWADALEGRLIISSVPGRGTQVTFHVPLKS